jgi:hypothetical protein
MRKGKTYTNAMLQYGAFKRRRRWNAILDNLSEWAILALIVTLTCYVIFK